MDARVWWTPASSGSFVAKPTVLPSAPSSANSGHSASVPLPLCRILCIFFNFFDPRCCAVSITLRAASIAVWTRRCVGSQHPSPTSVPFALKQLRELDAAASDSPLAPFLVFRCGERKKRERRLGLPHEVCRHGSDRDTWRQRSLAFVLNVRRSTFNDEERELLQFDESTQLELGRNFENRREFERWRNRRRIVGRPDGERRTRRATVEASERISRRLDIVSSIKRREEDFGCRRR